MNDTLKTALMNDIHKAMGNGLVPVKRMIRGKYGTYFAIRWVRSGEEQKGDVPIKNPTPEEFKQADAEATPEKASKLIDSIKATNLREMRGEIARMLQALGGGHDAHHAILEALEAKGVQFESTGNVLTTWSNALEPMMNYVRNRNSQRTPEPEPQPQKEEPKKEEPQPEPQKEEKPEPKSDVRTIDGVNFKGDKIFTPSFSGNDRPDDDAIRRIVAGYVSRMRGLKGNVTVSNVSYGKLDDSPYRNLGYYNITVEYTVSDDSGDRRMKKTVICPPFGKDAETVSIRGLKFAARLFQENCGRSLNVYRKMPEDDTTDYNALPVLSGAQSQFSALPEYVQQQLTYQSVISAVAKDIALGRALYSPETKQPHVIYNLSFAGYDEESKTLDIHAECRNEDGFDKGEHYSLAIGLDNLNIQNEEEWAESERAKKIASLKPQMDDLEDLIRYQRGLVAKQDAEYRRLQQEEADLPQKSGVAYSGLLSKMSANRAQRKQNKQILDENQADYDKLKAEYDGYFNIEKPEPELEGQQEISEQPQPKPKPKPKPEPEKSDTTRQEQEPEKGETSEEEQARLKAEDEVRQKKIGKKNSFQGLTLNTNAVARVEEQLAANNQQLEELNILRVKDGEVRLIASAYDTITGKHIKKPVYLKNGEGKDHILDSPDDTKYGKVSMDSADAVVQRIKSIPDYESTKYSGFSGEYAFNQFADSTAKGYEGVTKEQVSMVRGVTNALHRYDLMFSKYGNGIQAEADSASVLWKGAVQTAKIIDKCELSHDSVARKSMDANAFVQFFGLNPDDFREVGSHLTCENLSALNGYSFRANNFVDAYGTFDKYPSLGDTQIDVEFLLPQGSKAMLVDPFMCYGKTERGRDLTWDGNLDYDKAGFTSSYRSGGHLLIQRGSTYQIMKIAEESNGVGQKQYRAYILVGNQDPWSMEPHGQPPEDWSLDKPIYWEG